MLAASKDGVTSKVKIPYHTVNEPPTHSYKGAYPHQLQASHASIHWLYMSIASSRGAMSQRYELLQTLQETEPLLFSQSRVAVTVFIELQKGQLKVASSLGFCFFGGGFEDLRFPILDQLPADSCS